MCLTAPPKPQKPNNFSFSRGLLNRNFGYGMVNLSSQLPISTDGFGHTQMGMSQNLGTLMNVQKKQMKPIPMPVQKPNSQLSFVSALQIVFQTHLKISEI
jgi:hypothetical protein